MPNSHRPLSKHPTLVASLAAVVIAAGALVATSAGATPAPDPAPAFMPADPALLGRIGATGVRKLIGERTPELMYTELHDRRAKAGGAKIAGTGTALVVLWNFTDHPADQTAHPNAAYYNLLFSNGTLPTGSMNDYYREVSYGAYGVGGAVSGWTTSNRLYSYSGYVPHDPDHTRTMIQDAVAQLDATVNFALYDNDGPDGIPNSGDDDGYVDALFFVHPGPGQEQSGDPNDIWSHAWVLPYGGYLTNDGVRVYRYSVEPEETSSGNMVAVGVYCHEFGHVLGLPDLYDTDYTSSGVGDWCLMGFGSWNHVAGHQGGTEPAHLCAWCKQEMGWLTPVAVTTNTTGVTLAPAENNAVAYRIFRDGATTGSEYFLAENRQPILFDAGLVRRQIENGLPLPQGLLILHVDESRSSNDNELRRLVDVVEATPWTGGPGPALEHMDGPEEWPLTLKLNHCNRADNGDLWPGFAGANGDTTDWVAPRSRDRFADDTVPSANDASCDPTGLAIDNITLAGSNVTADFLPFTAKSRPAAAAAKAIQTWSFETGMDGWETCRSFVHFDQTQASGCAGAGGLWFGVNDPSWACPPGYGNDWNDFTWHRVQVEAGATVTLKHKYDVEADYDFCYVEVRCADDPSATWYTVALLTGTSGCVTNMWPIPSAAIAECLDPGNGTAKLDLRLRFTSDSGWSAQDGQFCGDGWWVDEVSVGGAVTGLGDPVAGATLPALLLPATPNPFNPATLIRFHVPAAARQVALAVYDQRGRLVRSLDFGEAPAGWLEKIWDGRDDAGRQLGSGVYFARLTVDGARQMQKLALIK